MLGGACLNLNAHTSFLGLGAKGAGKQHARRSCRIEGSS